MEEKGRNKIGTIIGGSALVLLVITILGITYAYYRTRIIGNENQSITVVSEILEVTYQDGTEYFSTSSMDEKIEPGFKYVKNFSVKNTGNAVASYNIVLDNISNEFTRPDWKYTLYSGTYTIDEYSNGIDSINKVTDGLIFDNSNINVKDGIIIETSNEVKYYTMVIEYLNLNEDQSDDMGSTLSLRVNINDEGASKALVDAIKNNAIANLNGTIYLNKSLTTAAKKQSSSSLTADTKGAKATKLTFIDVASSGTRKDGYADALNGIASPRYDQPRAYYSTIKPSGDCLSSISSLKANQFTKIATACPQINFNGGETVVTNDANSGGIEYDESTGKTPEFCNYVETTGNTYYLWDYNSDQVYTVNECIDDTPVVYAEAILSQTKDDYGTSYYYRGAVEDNYVNFANMCWKVVRIQGDNSVKLILEDQYAECNSSDYTGNWAIPTGNTNTPQTTYTGQYYLDNNTNFLLNIGNYGYTLENGMYRKNYSATGNSESSIADANTDFYNSKLKSYESSLKEENWCLNDEGYSWNSESASFTKLSNDQINEYYNSKTKFYYDTYLRIHYNPNPSLKCVGNSVTSYIGTISADEVSFAGSKTATTGANLNYYLINQFQKEVIANFYTISPFDYHNGADRMIAVVAAGNMTSMSIDPAQQTLKLSVRPSIVLKKGVEISAGNGTKTNPYVIG